MQLKRYHYLICEMCFMLKLLSEHIKIILFSFFRNCQLDLKYICLSSFKPQTNRESVLHVFYLSLKNIKTNKKTKEYILLNVIFT